MSPKTEVSDECFFQKTPSEWVISRERKLEKCGEIVFFDVHLKRSAFVYIKTRKSNKEFSYKSELNYIFGKMPNMIGVFILKMKCF